MLHTDLMVTTNQKPVIDMQKIKRQGIHAYHEREPANGERRGQERYDQRTTKTTTKQVTRWQ